MTLEIPYTFVPGTKAKANQVNEDFLAVKNAFDSNEDLLEQAQADILNLQSNKANIAGDNTKTFNVADATNNYNAVNLQTYKKLSANTIDLIQGYQLAKFDNNSVTAQPGSCYDSTKSIIITSNATLTATQANLTANATYYVYVTYDNETLALVIDLSNSAPGGYTNYRQLGYFKTDSNGYVNANTISYYGIDSNSDKSKNSSIDAIMPDWSNKSSKAVNTEYTADKYGYLFVRTPVVEASPTVTLILNGTSYDLGSGLTNREGGHSTTNFIPISIGDVYKVTSSTYGSWYVAYFIPVKGGN